MGRESQLTQAQWGDLLAGVRQLCRVYWGPSEALSREMLAGAFLQPFYSLGPLIETNTDAELAALDQLLAGFSGAQLLLDYLDAGYVRLFVNARDGVAAPLYASCYDDEAQPQLMGAPAVRMQKLLVDLNIHIRDEVREPPDHLAIQIEALYFLLTRDGADARSARLAAAADFVAAEMLPWLQSFQRHLAGEAECRFYPLITNLLLSVLQAILTLAKSGAELGSQ